MVRNGNDVWVYDSQDNSVSHATLTARGPLAHPGAMPQGDSAAPDPADLTPNGLATKLIAQLEKSSTLSVDSSLRVAGRPAYDLVLTPRVTDTLIGSVSIAVDAASGLPLQVRVDARGQKTPAVVIGFSSLDPSTPAASLFEFTPPAGATVSELTRPTGRAGSAGRPRHQACRDGRRSRLGCRRHGRPGRVIR